MGAGAAGVHHALGDPLAVEMADLLEELVVLEHQRAAVADRAGVLVVVDRVALARGQQAPAGRVRRGDWGCFRPWRVLQAISAA